MNSPSIHVVFVEEPWESPDMLAAFGSKEEAERYVADLDRALRAEGSSLAAWAAEVPLLPAGATPFLRREVSVWRDGGFNWFKAVPVPFAQDVQFVDRRHAVFTTGTDLGAVTAEARRLQDEFRSGQ